MDANRTDKKAKSGKSEAGGKQQSRKRPGRKTDSRKKDIQFWATQFMLPILLAVLASGGIFATWLANRSSPSSPSTSQSGLERVPIQDDFYHIGDVEFAAVVKNGEIVEKIYFSHPSPEANPFVKGFDLKKVPRNAVLHLTARSIDPDERTSPVKIYFNGKFSDFLNRYFTVETMNEKTVSIPVDVSLLQKGKNSIQIFVEATNLDGLGNVDDIEFWNVYLEILW